MLLDYGIKLFSNALTNNSYNKKIDNQLDYLSDTESALEEWNTKATSVNYLDSAEGKSATKTISDQKEKADTTAANNLARAGATAEEQVAQASAANSDYASALSLLAGVGSNKAQQQQETYYTTKSKLDSQVAELESSKKSLFDIFF